MSLFQLAILAIVQGITEWLPVSSSAHLILIAALTPMPDQGIMIDAMAHLGTMAAVLVFFRADIAAAMRGTMKLAQGAHTDPDARLARFLLIASPPALIAGLLLEAGGLSKYLRHIHVIAAATIGFAILLWIADRQATRRNAARTGSDVSLADAIWMGIAQSLAFIPGASRSGLVMTAARARGFTRSEAARLSLLLGAPLLAAAGMYSLARLGLSGAETSLRDGLWVCLLSFLSGLASISVLMALMRRMSFTPFVIYRLVLGALLFVLSPLPS